MTLEMTARTAEVGGLLFAYDDRVLTPRSWTAAQSDWARELLALLPDGPVLELFSGAGHIGLLSLLGNERSLVMVDCDEAACNFARRNAIAAALGNRVVIRRGRVEAAVIAGEIFPLVIADPPWVPSDQVERFPEDPRDAIDGGADGLGPTRACLRVIGEHLDREGSAVLQVGSADQVAAVRDWLLAHPGLRLTIGETRTFERGVLVLLRRPQDRTC